MRPYPVVEMHQVLADASLSLLGGHAASYRYLLCVTADIELTNLLEIH